MLTYRENWASVCLHCFNILYSSSRAVHWLMGYSLLRWCTLINADACKRVRVKETNRKEKRRGGGSNVLPLQISLTLILSLSRPLALIPSSLPVFLLCWSSLHICICRTLNTSALAQMTDECFLPEHMLHQATFRRLPDYSLSEINQQCVCVCVLSNQLFEKGADMFV